jgi:hypothetical protein
MILVTKRLSGVKPRKLIAFFLLIIGAGLEPGSRRELRLRQTDRRAGQFQACANRLAIAPIIEVHCHRALPYKSMPWGQPIFLRLTALPWVNNPYRMTHPISTVREAVRALGGTQKTAMLLKVGMPAVSNMIARGEFPQGHHLKLYLALRARGIAVDEASLFGIDPGRDLDCRTVVAA